MMNCSKIASGLLCVLIAFGAGYAHAGTPLESGVLPEVATRLVLAQAVPDSGTVLAPDGSPVAQPPAGPSIAQPPARPPAMQTLPRPQPGAPAAPAPLKSGEILLNFQSADLQAVVKAMSQMTGRNMLVDPRVRGQFTIVSARPMSVGAAYQVFLSALKAQGFTAVEGPGDIVRIIPVAEAKAAAPVNEQDTPPRGGEQIVTHVAVGQHVAVSQLQNVLRPLMSPTSQLSVYDPANALIITDYAENVRRLLRIIDRIDLPASTDVTVVQLLNASAIDVGELVVRLSSAGVTSPGAPGAPQTQIAVGGDRFSVVPDTRTNSLLLRSDNPGRVAQLRGLIEKLDVPARAMGSTRVIYLKHAEAAKLVEVLRGMLAAAAGGAPGAPPGAGAPGRPGAAPASLVQADEPTNSIIINASDTVYNNLRTVIEQLDIRRPQVYVEALIVEMTTDSADELGVQWAAATTVGSNTVGAAANFPSAAPSLAVAAAAQSGGAAAAALISPAGLSVGVLRSGSLGALARALASNSQNNILSTPTLLTLDNFQAKIVVGQNVPFLTGSFAQATSTVPGAGGAVNPFQTIERKDVGLTLRIKPQISEGGTIRMEIFQEVSSIARSALTGASDIITNKRSIETKVVVEDGSTIVLGGLIDDTVTQTQEGIPLLSSIPFVGALFRYRKDTRARTNLMVFLRPVIIRSADDSYRVTTDRFDYLRSYTRGESAEREALFDRMEPAPPPAVLKPLTPGAAPAPPDPAAPKPPAPAAAPAPPG